MGFAYWLFVLRDGWDWLRWVKGWEPTRYSRRTGTGSQPIACTRERAFRLFRNWKFEGKRGRQTIARVLAAQSFERDFKATHQSHC